jgi:Alpha-kinase family
VAGTCKTITECQEYVRERRQGSILKRSSPSFSVAVKKTAFGEGAERVAFKFRYLDAAGRFVGPKMVAKESRFMQDQDDYSDPDQNDDGIDNNIDQMTKSHTTGQRRRAYHTQFLQTQAIAARFADLFNKALDDLVKLAPKRFRRQLKQYPGIRFVEPLVFELQEANNHSRYDTMVAAPPPPMINYLLVEPMIEGTYRKFNNNMGAVVDVRATTENEQKKDGEPKNENYQSDHISQAQEMMLMSRNDLHSTCTSSSGGRSSSSQLSNIKEGSEGSCSGRDDDEHDGHANSNKDSGDGARESRAKSTRNIHDNSNHDEWCIDKSIYMITATTTSGASTRTCYDRRMAKVAFRAQPDPLAMCTMATFPKPLVTLPTSRAKRISWWWIYKVL